MSQDAGQGEVVTVDLRHPARADGAAGDGLRSDLGAEQAQFEIARGEDLEIPRQAQVVARHGAERR